MLVSGPNMKNGLKDLTGKIPAGSFFMAVSGFFPAFMPPFHISDTENGIACFICQPLLIV